MIARYSRPAMARIWSDESRLETWLRVELAAVDAWAELGVVPAADARETAYAAVERIHFPGARYRRDVAAERGQRVGG